MTCEELRRLLVQDERPDAEILAHGAHCPACATLLRQERALRSAVSAWRQRTSVAPPGLQQRILEAYAGERGAWPAPPDHADAAGDGRDAIVELRPRWHAPASPIRWLAAAAGIALLVLVALGAPRLGGPRVVSVSGDLLVADVLDEARQAERAHAEAIARLVEATRPVLARADDPATPPAEAALLRSYRDRLSSLDDAIADVQGFLDTNPGHPAARTVLLAAYMDKTELLGEILAHETEENA